MNARQNQSSNETRLPEEQHQQYIENANYHIEKIGGFHRGFNLEKWLAVETKIEQSLAEQKY